MSELGSSVGETSNIMPAAPEGGVAGSDGVSPIDVNAMHDGNNTESVHDFGRDGTFPDHPKVGPWYNLMGRMLAPWEFDENIDTKIEGGDARVNVETTSPSWDSTIIVNTPDTPGIGVNAGPTDIPNHHSEG